MANITFLGIVVPRGLAFTVHGAIPMGLKPMKNPHGPDDQFEIREVEVDIKDSAVTVFVRGVSDGADMFSVRNLVEWHAQVFADVAGLNAGMGYRVVLDQVRLDDGTVKPIDFRMTVVKSIFSLDVNKTFWAAHAHPQLRLAMRNYREACVVAGDAPFYCQRTIEGICAHWNSGNKPNELAYSAAAKALNSEREVTDFVYDHAWQIRHGASRWVPAILKTKLLKYTGLILMRFITYLSNGSKDLAAPDFPLLKLESGDVSPTPRKF